MHTLCNARKAFQFYKSSSDPCVICVEINEFLRGKYHNNGHTRQDASHQSILQACQHRARAQQTQNTVISHKQHIHLRMKIMYRYLSNESTLSCRDAGFPPNVTRVRGFLVTTGSTGLSDPDECCFSIFHFYELSLAGCECITVYCVRFESLGSHFCLCLWSPHSFL